jgi:hypothetical protein
MEVVYNKKLIAHGRANREARGEEVKDVDFDRESRDGALSDMLLDAYNTLAVAPLEVFGVGDCVAEERTRYLMMGRSWRPWTPLSASSQPPGRRRSQASSEPIGPALVLGSLG